MKKFFFNGEQFLRDFSLFSTDRSESGQIQTTMHKYLGHNRRQRTMIDYVNTEELSFADWLLQTMTDNKLKASQLSRALSTEEHKVNRSTISLWLSGDRTPRDKLQARLANYLSSLLGFSYHPMIREIIWRVHISKMRKL